MKLSSAQRKINQRQQLEILINTIGFSFVVVALFAALVYVESLPNDESYQDRSSVSAVKCSLANHNSGRYQILCS